MKLVLSSIVQLFTGTLRKEKSELASYDTGEKLFSAGKTMARGRDEAYLIQKFRKEIMTIFPKAFFYKIPDFPGGPLRPYDVELKINGANFALEFKGPEGTLQTHQRYFLDLAEANGSFSMVVRPENWHQCIKDIVTLVKKREEEGFNAN